MNNRQEKIILSADQIRSFKKSAHHLKPVVQVGKKGATPSLIQEINHALDAHELIKIQWLPQAKLALNDDVAYIVEHTGAAFIAHIGNLVIFFRPNEKKESP